MKSAALLAPHCTRCSKLSLAAPQIADTVGETAFLGYNSLTSPVTLVAMVVDGKPATAVAATAGKQVELVLDGSPFYAESGGQVGDRGVLHLSSDAGQLSVRVTDVQKAGGGRVFVHYGEVVCDGRLKVGANVTATVDSVLRRRVRTRAPNCCTPTTPNLPTRLCRFPPCRPSVTTLRLTSCKLRSRLCLVMTSPRPARWSTLIACALTSTARRCPLRLSWRVSSSL